MKHKKKIIAAIAVAVVTLLGAGAFFGYRLYVIHQIKEAAAAFGITIESVDDFHLGKDALVLDGVTFSFAGVPGSSATAKTIETGLDRPPKRASLRGVEVTFTGRAGAWLTAMSKWSRAHADVFALSLTATDVRISAREQPGDASWLALGNAMFSTRGKDLSINAKEATVIGMKAAPLALTWAADGSRAGVAAFGEGAAAMLKAEIKPIADGAVIDATIPSTTIADLAARLNLNLSSRAKVAIHTTITVRGAGGFDGNATASVDGWIPDHPKELDGILYGNKTSATVGFKTSDDRTKVLLDPVTVKAGALDLKGNGAIDHEAPDPRARSGDRGGDKLGHVRVDLQGSLPCSQVARSAAAEMGGIMGSVVGLLGEHAAQGNVAIHVRAEGELAELRKIKITHDEKSGCTLGI